MLAGMSVALGLLNLFIVLLNHYYFRTVALDYAIYNFAFYDFAHGRLSPVPAYIFPFPVTFLQDHFSLTLIFLSPLYWVMAPLFGTYSLLIIQWFFILAGAWGTLRLIRLKSGNPWLSWAAVLFYFLLFGRYSAYRADVNLAIMGSAIVPVFLYFFESGQKWKTIWCFVFLLFNREDYSLWLIFIGIWLLIVNRKDPAKRLWSGLIVVCSIVFFMLVLYLFIPLLEDENKKYALFDFSIVGETPKHAFLFIITHPLEALRYLFVNHNPEDYYNGIKFDFYLVYLVSGGVLLLLRPAYLIPLIPLLAKKMYDDNPLRWSSETYYSIEFVNLLPVLLFLILIQFASNVRIVLTVLLLLAASSVTVFKILVPPPNPVVGESNKYNFIRRQFYRPERDLFRTREMLEKIPPGSSVSGGCRLIPHLAFREKVYYFPFIADAARVILFKKDDSYPLSPEEYDKRIMEMRVSGEWRIEENEEVILFTRQDRQ